MDKQSVAYNRLLFHHKKDWSINSSYNTDEPWKYDAKWKKPNIKSYTFYDSIYIKCLEWTQKVLLLTARNWRKGQYRVIAKGYGIHFWGWEALIKVI